MKPVKWIAAAILVGGPLVTPLATGALAAAPEETLLVVEEAQSVQTFELSPTVRQINYTADLAYPAQAVGEPQWQQLEAAGWHRCHASQAAADTDWVQSIDESVTPNRTVHERLTHWSRDDQLIAVKLRYYSAAAGPTPDNSTQRIHLVFYSERAAQMSNYLKIDCGQ